MKKPYLNDFTRFQIRHSSYGSAFCLLDLKWKIFCRNLLKYMLPLTNVTNKLKDLTK